MNSWLASMRCPDFTAIARAIDSASVNPRMVTANAMGATRVNVASEKSGPDSGGKPAGRAPTVAMLVMALPNRCSMASAAMLPATIAPIMYGNRGT